MTLAQKLAELKRKGVWFTYSKSGATIGDHKQQIVILNVNLTFSELESLCDAKLAEISRGEAFAILEELSMISYI